MARQTWKLILRLAGSLARGFVYLVASPVILLADLVQPDPEFDRHWVVGFTGFITVAIVLTWGLGYVVAAQTLEGSALASGYSEISANLAKVPYLDHIQFYAVQHGLDPALIAAIISQESGFDPNAMSRAGARGLMQILPATWQLLNPTSSCDGEHAPPAMGRDCIFDPEANIRVGTAYFAGLLEQFDGNVVLAFAAYNAGTAVVRRYAGGDLAAGLDDLPPFAETRGYVRRVLAFWMRLRSGGEPDVITLTAEETRVLRQMSTVMPVVVLGLWSLFAAWVLRRFRLA